MPLWTEMSEFALTQLQCLLVISRPTVLWVPGHSRILLKTTRSLSSRSLILQKDDRHTKNVLRLPCRLMKQLSMLLGVPEKLMSTHDVQPCCLNLLVTASPLMCCVFLTSRVASFREDLP